ncbi:hypothetical protein FACS1894106_2790 [Spirochaetia bacterium]|nr:hypothetical protein FACS1894106_2790 [Spirochaetia bacterium]
MKIKLPAHAALYKGYIVLKEVNNQGKALIEKFFSTKNRRDGYNGKDFIVQVELDLPYQKRTFKQNSSVWILVTAIFQSMEGRLPDEEEKYGLYLDLLEQYAEKVSNRFGGMRPVHISESNSYEGARFIDGLLYHLATLCDLDTDTQSDVVSVLQDWENWRGNLEADPLDYADLACTRLLTEEEWREKHRVSEASGSSGDIVRAHIVSRGADHPDIEMAWNWLALLHDEHMDQHQKGWDEFLRIYPHLKGKVDRARRLAGKLELKNLSQSGSSLALEALEA